MICAAICLTLLTMIAAMHLLAKSKKEELGSMFKWISYFILAAATTVLVCQSICAVHMCCSNRCGYGMEQCMGMHHPGMRGDCMEKCETKKIIYTDDMKCDDKKMCPHDMNMSGKDSACCKDEHHKEVEVKEEKK